MTEMIQLPPQEMPRGPTSRGPAAFLHPDDVLADAALAPAEKRAILAGWASDAHAVEDAPTLRQLDSGAIIPVADIMAALKRLDMASEDAPNDRGPETKTMRCAAVTDPTTAGDPDDDPPFPPAMGAHAYDNAAGDAGGDIVSA